MTILPKSEREAIRTNVESWSGLTVVGTHADSSPVTVLSADTTLALLDSLDAHEEALAALVKKWDVVLPYINSAQGIAHVHGWRYGGPPEGIKPEFDAARALTAPTQLGEEQK